MAETKFAKVAIDQKTNDQVDEALVKVNQGFDGGRVSKTDFMSWLLSNGIERLNTTMIAEIRMAYFNQVAYLDGLVKRLKTTQRTNLTGDERKLLKIVLDSGSTREKKSSSTLPPRAEVTQDKISS